MDCRHFPSAREILELGGRRTALHREQSSAADAKMAGPLDERRSRPDRARHDAVEALLRTEDLRALVHGFDIVELERLRRVLDELELLRGRVEQRETPLRIDERERQAW